MSDANMNAVAVDRVDSMVPIRVAIGFTPAAVEAANGAKGFCFGGSPVDHLVMVGDEIEASGRDGLVRVVYRVATKRFITRPAVDVDTVLYILDLARDPIEPCFIIHD